MHPLLAGVFSVVAAAAASAQPSFVDLEPDSDYAQAAFGAQAPADVVPIVEHSFEMMHDGSHKWSFEGGDGTGRWEEAAPAWTGAGVRGGYGYVGDEGPVAVSYVADRYGFQPTGNAVHPDIVKAVALQVAQAKAEPEGMWDENGFPVFSFHHDYADY